MWTQSVIMRALIIQAVCEIEFSDQSLSQRSSIIRRNNWKKFIVFLSYASKHVNRQKLLSVNTKSDQRQRFFQNMMFIIVVLVAFVPHHLKADDYNQIFKEKRVYLVDGQGLALSVTLDVVSMIKRTFSPAHRFLAPESWTLFVTNVHLKAFWVGVS